MVGEETAHVDGRESCDACLGLQLHQLVGGQRLGRVGLGRQDAGLGTIGPGRGERNGARFRTRTIASALAC